NIFGPGRGREAGQAFHGLAEGEGVDVGADAAHALHESDDLDVIARLGQMLNATEVEADMQLGVGDSFAGADKVQLVGLFEGWVIRAHGDFVAHFVTSSRRFTPGVSPWRSSSGSYSRPRKSMAKPSFVSRSIQSTASQRS